MKLREFYYLHHADRQVIVSILVIAAVVVGLIFFVGGRDVPSSSAAAADSLGAVASLKGSVRSPKYYAQPVKKPVRNIYKYRASGGIYRTKADFARLYGLTVKQYRELEPYIVISPDYLPASTLFADRPAYGQGTASGRSDDAATNRSIASGGAAVSGDSAVTGSKSGAETYRRQYKIAVGEHVDLNAGDTAVYKTVPGIGSYYARKIADYGRRLGGYVSIDQLDEIENFPPEAKAYFALLTDSVRKMNVNELTLYELRRHPYRNYYQAKAIVDHRRLDGPLKSLDELGALRDFPPEAIARLKPYVIY